MCWRDAGFYNPLNRGNSMSAMPASSPAARIAVPAVAFVCALALAACQPSPALEDATEAAAPARAVLDGQSWQVLEIAGQPLVANSAPTIAFADGRVSGQGSCNRFMGNYVVSADGAALKMSEMASTMMACPAPLMTQEDNYLRLLEAVQSYRIDGDVLTLRTEAGDTIRARRQSAE